MPLNASGAANNSGTLPSSLWLERIADRDGDGLLEIRVGVPGFNRQSSETIRVSGVTP